MRRYGTSAALGDLLEDFTYRQSAPRFALTPNAAVRAELANLEQRLLLAIDTWMTAREDQDAESATAARACYDRADAALRAYLGWER